MNTASALPLHRTAPRPSTLPVEENWSCKGSGDCCRQLEYVGMTLDERNVLQEFADKHLPIRVLNKINWVTGPGGLEALVAKPCPLYEPVSKKCLVYEVRPYNCRRFACMRPDPAAEPLKLTAPNPVLAFSTFGCDNLAHRLLESRVARRLYEGMQRKAQRWARKHGWKDDAS